MLEMSARGQNVTKQSCTMCADQKLGAVCKLIVLNKKRSMHLLV
jgi:hypothetical protein